MATSKKGRSNIISGRTEARHKSRMRFYLANIILGLLIFIIATALLIFILFPFEDIRVEGNTFYDEEVYVPYVVTDDFCINTLYIMVKSMFVKQENPEFVEDIDLSIEKRKTILVTVTEKEWTGYCVDSTGKYVYYDKDGNVVEVSERLIEGHPESFGLIVEEPVVGEPLPVDNTLRRNLVQVQDFFSMENIAYDSIYFNSDGTITVYVNGGNVEVALGTSALLREKTRRLPYILPKIEGMSGVLHLEDWTEDSTDIVFEKR